ncbi:MAG: DUF4197 domain-containing protein [Betaproteobacteria bacterium]|nr:MAG: DUF4197 domain-containing protein [Betaproteobacteria bacterium]
MRTVHRLCIAAVTALLLIAQAQAFGLADLSNKDAASGLKEALIKGSQEAVTLLAKQNGFLGNERVRIPLPESLQKIEGMLRAFGMGKYADELVTTMNRAAETAVVEAKPLLVNAVKGMSVQDAKGILTGGDDAATQYFRRSTSAALSARFLPIVTKATQKVKLADKYNEFAGKGAKLGLIDKKDADLNSYVTQKALDGLFLMIADEEKKIRKDPLGSASSIISKVFGALGK